MTDTHYDRAPGDASALPDVEQGTSSGVLVYTIGLALAVTLTAMSFWVANTSLLWAGGVSLGLTVLAIAQMGIHLVFFLHVTAGLVWLAVMMAQVAIKGFRATVERRLLCFSLFWHALDIVWVWLFTVVYLMGVVS